MQRNSPAQVTEGSHDNSRVLVIVPTYNERENIARMIDTVLAQDPRIELLIVDDGSPDGTAEIVERMMARHPGRIHIHKRPGKMGLGTAYLAGFRIAIERKYDFIMEMDADFSHDPSHLSQFLK